MTQQTASSPDELAEVLKNHIPYELGRLVATYKLMREPQYRNALEKNDAENVDDALIVSFCTHARNMLEFFHRKDHRKWRYALAIDYAKPGYKSLERAGRADQLFQQLCAQINHLTYERTDKNSKKIGVAERDELIRIIHQEVKRLVTDLRPEFGSQYFMLDVLAKQISEVPIKHDVVGASSEPQTVPSLGQVNETTHVLTICVGSEAPPLPIVQSLPKI